MKKVLSKTFFDRPVLEVAPDLLGKYLVRDENGAVSRFLITEVEAYDGPKDLACHAAKGKTARTSVMFGEAGRWYVYFVYGMYWMLNIVTGPKDYPAAVLIRGTREISGPGRLTRDLHINGTSNGTRANPETGLWFENGEKLERKNIKRTPRIGVAYAGPVWSKKKYRFVLEFPK